jgi:hypothetical protein
MHHSRDRFFYENALLVDAFLKDESLGQLLLDNFKWSFNPRKFTQVKVVLQELLTVRSEKLHHSFVVSLLLFLYFGK